jgi:hypothetical protein
MMGAFEPWSGHYDVSVAVWSQAQTTQFVEIGECCQLAMVSNLSVGPAIAGRRQPTFACRCAHYAGYFMLGVTTGGSGLLAGGGTYVTYAAIEVDVAPT